MTAAERRITELSQLAIQPYVVNDEMNHAIYNVHSRQFEVDYMDGSHMDLFDGDGDENDIVIILKFQHIIASLMRTSTPFVLYKGSAVFYSRSRIWTYQFMMYDTYHSEYVHIEPKLTSVSAIHPSFSKQFDQRILKFEFSERSACALQTDRVLIYEHIPNNKETAIVLIPLKCIRLPSDHEVVKAECARRNVGKLIIRNVLTREQLYGIINREDQMVKWFKCSSGDLTFGYSDNSLLSVEPHAITYDINPPPIELEGVHVY